MFETQQKYERHKQTSLHRNSNFAQLSIESWNKKKRTEECSTSQLLRKNACNQY